MPFQAGAVQLAGRGLSCDVCGSFVVEMWSCAACALQGHRGCLSIDFVAGYAFCSRCAPQARLAYEAHTQLQRDRWMQNMSRQYATWRQMLISTSGVASSIGFAAGTATGTMLAGAASLTQGVAAGVMTAVRGPPGLQVPHALPLLQPHRFRLRCRRYGARGRPRYEK